jgi:hypothetical protein
VEARLKGKLFAEAFVLHETIIILCTSLSASLGYTSTDVIPLGVGLALLRLWLHRMDDQEQLQRHCATALVCLHAACIAVQGRWLARFWLGYDAAPAAAAAAPSWSGLGGRAAEPPAAELVTVLALVFLAVVLLFSTMPGWSRARAAILALHGAPRVSKPRAAPLPRGRLQPHDPSRRHQVQSWSRTRGRCR